MTLAEFPNSERRCRPEMNLHLKNQKSPFIDHQSSINRAAETSLHLERGEAARYRLPSRKFPAARIASPILFS